MSDAEDDADLDEIVQDALRDRPPAPTEAEIQAALADPTFAAIAARAVKPYDKTLTRAGKEKALRTLAVVFLANPRAASLLAGARSGQPADASRTQVAADAAVPETARRSKP
jgi:hypothetical protein